jgi:hypothetical protein
MMEIFMRQLVRQGIGKPTLGALGTRWLQARRAWSDAPHHVGLAISFFDFIADFEVRAYFTVFISGASP